MVLANPTNNACTGVVDAHHCPIILLQASKDV